MQYRLDATPSVTRKGQTRHMYVLYCVFCLLAPTQSHKPDSFLDCYHDCSMLSHWDHR